MFLVTILFGLLAVGIADPVARIHGGQEVDSLRQFPYHVYICCLPANRKCGGSILNEHWVLTSASCIKDTPRLEMHFGKKNEYDVGSGYYSLSVNSDQVYVYPTNFDDLALIRLPMSLVFSDTISPVNITKLSIEELRNKFAVLAGFPTTLPGDNANPQNFDNLKYGMFNVVEPNACKQAISQYDEYNYICAQGWGNNPNTPCDSDFGSGLVIGWPAHSELIGMFSMYSPSCDANYPSMFTYVPKYMSWISSMIQG